VKHLSPFLAENTAALFYPHCIHSATKSFACHPDIRQFLSMQNQIFYNPEFSAASNILF
jgi:hypothetical protein